MNLGIFDFYCAICGKELTIDDMLAGEEICDECRGDVEDETR